MPQKSKPKKKKTGGAKRSAQRPGADERGATSDATSHAKSEAAQAKDEAAAWVAAERAEIEHMESKMARDSGWVSFTLSKAPWLNFSIDRSIDTALDDSYIGGSDEVVARWMHRAESSIIYWIINKIIEVDGRAELFRSLGRGWIFILLRRPQRKFKWWFEGVNRVLRNHKSDIDALNLPAGGLEKYTQGYVCQSEIVFLMKGLTPTRIIPIISIQKMANDFEHLHKWATNDDARKAVMTPFPTDEERQAHAARAQKRREKKARERAKKAAQKQADAEAAAADTTAISAYPAAAALPSGRLGSGSEEDNDMVHEDGQRGNYQVSCSLSNGSTSSEPTAEDSEATDDVGSCEKGSSRTYDTVGSGVSSPCTIGGAGPDGFEARVGGLCDEQANDSFEDLLAQMKAEMQ